MAFEYFRFAFRNPLYYVRNWRGQSKVRRSMLNYREVNPTCAYCGRTKHVDIHHKVPVSIDPLLAHVQTNMVTLCRKPPCHQIIGHNGHFGGRFEENIDGVIQQSKVVKVKKNDW